MPFCGQYVMQGNYPEEPGKCFFTIRGPVRPNSENSPNPGAVGKPLLDIAPTTSALR